MTLKRKIVEMEKIISLSFALMTGATAAIAEPPQMAVPAPIRVVVSRSSPKRRPTPQATKKDVSRVKIMTEKDWEPISSTWNKFISNPSKMMEYCRIFFPVKRIPLSQLFGRRTPANKMPSKMPKTGPPIIGNSWPRK